MERLEGAENVGNVGVKEVKGVEEVRGADEVRKVDRADIEDKGDGVDGADEFDVVDGLYMLENIDIVEEVKLVGGVSVVDDFDIIEVIIVLEMSVNVINVVETDEVSFSDVLKVETEPLVVELMEIVRELEIDLVEAVESMRGLPMEIEKELEEGGLEITDVLIVALVETVDGIGVELLVIVKEPDGEV